VKVKVEWGCYVVSRVNRFILKNICDVVGNMGASGSEDATVRIWDLSPPI
jgi:hypothetical protein